MDIANTLLRSVSRAFYPPEQIIIMDAVLLHSALRDDDLALLLGQQTKHLRKVAYKLREDGLLSVHQRDEIREGANRSFKRDYYFVDTHRAIDVVKFRIKSMHRAVDAKYGQAVGEKHEWQCPRCRATYTALEVLDDLNPSVGFMCKRCRGVLEAIEDDEGVGSAGHEVQSRLNAQLSHFEDLLRRIDDADVPENTFETALERALPIKRNESINPAARTEVVGRTGLPPATVHGIKTEPEKVEVSLLDEQSRRQREAEEAERRIRAKEQNVLPAWHTSSTVGARSSGTALGTDSGTGTPRPKNEEAEEEKKVDKLVDEEEDKKKADDEQLQQYFAAMEQGDDEEDEDEEDDDDDDEDSDEAEDSDAEAADALPPEKRMRMVGSETLTQRLANGVSNGALKDEGGSSGDDSGD